MILSMSGQGILFLNTVLIGLLLGFVYDIFRILRKTFKHNDFLTHIEDILYWIMITCIMFYYMLNKNYGEIRIFTIIGSLIGMVLYFLTISIIIMKVSMTVVNIIKKIVGFIVKIIMFPITLIGKILLIPIRFIKKYILKLKEPTRKIARTARNYTSLKKKKLKNDVKIILKKI